MLRLINLGLLFSLLVFAGVIYQVKYAARGVDSGLGLLGAEIEKEREQIAVLRAEWSLLNSPQRIERLSRAHLALDTAQAKQLVSFEALDEMLAAQDAQLHAAVPADPSPTASIAPSR